MKISAILRNWYELNSRDLPWRHTTDAYRIWLSEIILQQTRVVQGLDYYLRFIDAFPEVADLAQASEDDVLKLWQGLGYYSRARNLHKAAQVVMAEHGGIFPTCYSELIKLPGIGPYTAAAIASFSSGEAKATIDGNVYRVLSRLFDIEVPIDTPTGQKLFAELAQQELDTRHAAQHNQAIMEFGALHCTPTSPHCDDCPLADHCLSLEHHTQGIRPVKATKVKVRTRHIHYYIFKYGNKLWAHQRRDNDIWKGLWEFCCREESGNEQPAAGNTPVAPFDPTPIATWKLKHQLTHQTLLCSFSLILLNQPLAADFPGDTPITWDEWLKKAVPKPIFEINEKISPYFV